MQFGIDTSMVVLFTYKRYILIFPKDLKRMSNIEIDISWASMVSYYNVKRCNNSSTKIFSFFFYSVLCTYTKSLRGVNW